MLPRAVPALIAARGADSPVVGMRPLTVVGPAERD
jgi:hypothetical protein